MSHDPYAVTLRRRLRADISRAVDGALKAGLESEEICSALVDAAVDTAIEDCPASHCAAVIKAMAQDRLSEIAR